MCGINVARIVQNQGSKLFQMFSSEVPDGLVTRLAQSRLEPQKEGLSAIAGLHFFTFGVAPKTADFIKAMKDGAFRMKPDNDGFDLN